MKYTLKRLCLILAMVAILAAGGLCVQASAETYPTRDQAVTEIREQMKQRNPSFVIYVSVDEVDEFALAKSLFNDALVHTGVPTEGDYLGWQYSKAKITEKLKTENGKTKGYIEYTVTYHTTAEQEKAVDAEVKRILDKLNLYDACDADKVYGIYDYICKNVKYDYSYSDNPILNSAYGAFINKKCVCQGYVLMFYRLALELGVDSRVITGENHGWNIVELEGLYYNLDSTWDAGKYPYKYYLKSQENFTNHTRDNVYNTAGFHQKYPMGLYNYCGGSGTIGNGVSWRATSDGTLTISGKGALPDYQGRILYDTDQLPPWYLFSDVIRTVIIKDGITKIGNYSFAGYPMLTNVTMANSVTAIGTAAFAGADFLENVTFSKNLEQIGASAFSATPLTRVELPAKLKMIKGRAFYDCDALTSITLPKGLEQIGDEAFAYCTGLTKVSIPTSVTSAGDHTFSNCTALREITMYAANHCGEGFLKNCTNLEKVNFSPDEYGYIGNIPKEMFYGCSSLLTIDLPNVYYIGQSAFQDCTGLQSFHFTGGEGFEADAFLNCHALQEVYTDSVSVFSLIKFANAQSNPTSSGALLYDSNGLVTHVTYAPSYGRYNQYTFYGCTSLISVHCDGEYVGKYAFANCSNLKYVTMRDANNQVYVGHSGCNYIEKGAFANCYKLEWIEFGNGMSSVQENAFLNCAKLQTVYLNREKSCWAAISSTDANLTNVNVVANSKAPIACGTAHNWGQWSELWEGDCNNAGIQARKCAVCLRFEGKMVPKTSHQYGTYLTVRAATCEVPGLERQYCQTCRRTYNSREIAPLGHVFTHFFSNGNATTQTDGTKSALCDRVTCSKIKVVADPGSKLPTSSVTKPTPPSETIKPTVPVEPEVPEQDETVTDPSEPANPEQDETITVPTEPTNPEQDETITNPTNPVNPEQNDTVTDSVEPTTPGSDQGVNNPTPPSTPGSTATPSNPNMETGTQDTNPEVNTVTESDSEEADDGLLWIILLVLILLVAGCTSIILIKKHKSS